jgi:hypothetical protein
MFPGNICKIFSFCSFFILLNLFGDLFAQSSTINKQQGIAVVELFTSQADINSPPADLVFSQLIAQYEKNENVFFLSMHVDFWNRFGWKDPYSSFKFTNRLKNYSSVFGDKEIYTPFMIVNGDKKVNAANKNEIKAAIEDNLKNKASFSPLISYSIFDDTLDVSYDLQAAVINKKSGSDMYINFAITERSSTTKVTAGDNAGKTLSNQNVTILFNSFNLNAAKGIIRIPLKQVKPSAGRRLIVFVQEKRTRKITGAGSVEFSK